MLNNKLRLITAVWLLLGVTLVLTSPSIAAVTVGSKAPMFELGRVDGDVTVKLSECIGKPTLLVFWASWCPHCRAEAPVVQRVYDGLKDKGINILGISADEKLSDAQAFVKRYNLTYPNVFAGTEQGRQVLKDYGVQGIPALYLLDKDGIVRNTWAGEVNEQVLKEAFASLGMK